MTLTQPVWPELVVLAGSRHGMDPETVAFRLELLDQERRRREQTLIEEGRPVWAGTGITVRVIPSREVLDRLETLRRIENLARFGRKAGIRIQLVDLERPGARMGTLATFGGSAVLRDMTGVGDDPTVSWLMVDGAQLTELAKL